MILVMAGSALTGYYIELLTLFGIVFVHELGHVIAARGFGWKVTEVQLLPFGGVAVVDDPNSASALEEIAVAVAGPLQNGWMIIISLGLKQLEAGSGEWFDYFIYANLMIGLFNLLPIYPLDGGRVLQAVCGLWMTYHRSIVFISWLSLALSFMLLVSSLAGPGKGIQLNLFVIALFLFYSNWYRLRHLPYLFIRFLMNRRSMGRLAQTASVLARPIIVNGQQTVPQIVRLFMHGQYHLIYILNEAGAFGTVVPEEQLIESYFSETHPGSAVSDLFM